jgi:hypothetical protein
MKGGLLSLALLLAGCAHGPAVPRGEAFWRGLRDAKFVLPAGERRDEVLRDAVQLVDARDPVLRDDVGYGLVVAWVYREHAVSPDSLSQFTTALQQRLRAREGDGLGRSFAALSLSIVAAAELTQPVLGDAQFSALVDDAVAELEGETDLRGHEPGLGWVHATAHTADLLKFLARDARLTAAQQDRIVGAVAQRLARGPAFTWGEDERLAGVLRSLVLRPDARLEPLETWLASLAPQWKALWAAPVLERDRYAHLTNVKQTLRAVLPMLATVPAGTPAEKFRLQALEVVLGLQ